MTSRETSQSNLANLKRPESQAAVTRAQSTAVVPAGFPRRECMGGTKLFKALYGNPTRSTWAKWKRDGTIPAPDKQIGKLSFWWEVRMWRTLLGDASAAENLHAGPFDLSSAEAPLEGPNPAAALKADANETAVA
ncbi:hypothetical protein ACT4MK_22410 [Bradyrhizobium barranii]|uniref:hypothetical protein n=1 Tax=Bradyrhizobium barranii TaxID=2992140 RepID=UPI0040332817